MKNWTADELTILSTEALIELGNSLTLALENPAMTGVERYQALATLWRIDIVLAARGPYQPTPASEASRRRQWSR